MTSAKDQIQQQVNHWVQMVKTWSAVKDNLQDAGRGNDPEFKQAARISAEYKGRIYGARYIADTIGLDLETSFL